MSNKTEPKQETQHGWYSHVASSASIPASSLPASVRGNNNTNQNMHHIYVPNTGYYDGIVSGGVGNVSASSCAIGSGDGGGGNIFDLESRNFNTVTYTHNQLLQYQQQQQQPHQQQMGVELPAHIISHGLNQAQNHGYMNRQQQQRQQHHQQQPHQLQPHQQQQHNHYHQNIQNSMTLDSLESEEMIIKSEPLDEIIYKSNNYIDDNAPFLDFKPKYSNFSAEEMLNSKIDLNIKDENITDMQKPLNFPRRKVQNEKSESPPICQRCKQVFFKKQIYMAHVAESNCDIVEYDFKCTICPMSFMSMEELEKHKQLHRTNMFFCHKNCGKYFDTIADCETHEYMQHEYQTFVCNTCSSTFPTRELLYTHLPQHKYQQRYDCSVCRLWFQTPQELHEHRLSAPYFCGKYYMTARNNIQQQLQQQQQQQSQPQQQQQQHINYLNPIAAKQHNSNQSQGNFKFQDCRMGIMDMHSHQYQSPSTASNATTTTSSFRNQRFPYEQHQQQSQQQQHQQHSQQQNQQHSQQLHQQHSQQQQQQQQACNVHNNYFQVPSIKTEIKVEPGIYPTTNDYQQQIHPSAQQSQQQHHQPQHQHQHQQQPPTQQSQQQQQQQHTPHSTCSNYTNDSFSSSHSSSGFTNDCNDTDRGMFNAQQAQAANASTLDDSDDAVCCVPLCGVRKSTSPTLQFFTFPKDEKYLHQWLSNLKMLHVPQVTILRYRICSLHFPKRCINRYSLCYWAVPTFNLGHDDVANLYQNRELTNTFTSGEVARCSMPNCKSQRGESNVKFYNFPKDIKSLIKWCQNARLPVQAKEPRHFCGRHFEDRCIGKFRLKPWAVPTLNLGTPFGKIHDNPQNLYVEEKRCCLPFCRRSRSSDFNMSLYRFPRDETLLQRWCFNLRLDPNVYRGKNHKICSAHFLKEALGLRKLSPGAVPTLNLGHNDTFNIYENELYTPPPPPPQKMYYRQSNPTSMPTHNSNYDSMFFPPDSTSPYSSITSASSTPNVTESMDICCVPGCESKRHNSSDVTFHTIPRRPEQMRKWCHNLKMDEDKMHKGLRICSLHFEPFCIGGCMRPFAVPTLHLGHDDQNIYRNPDVIKKLNIRETCCVQVCKRNRERDHANLHRFPSNPVMLQKWCENLRKPVPDGTKLFNDAICEVHFEERCLRNKRLEKWSIPTLVLGHDELIHQLPSETEISDLYARPSAPNIGDEEGECCIESCKRNPEVDDIKLYRTPEDQEVLAKWAHNLQLDTEDLTALRICNLHFESHCIGKRLHPWAVPTLNLGTNIEHLYENPEQPVCIKKDKIQRYYSGASATKPTWVPRCCLPHCRKVRAIHNVQLFRFPSNNRSMLAKWCHNLQMPLVGSAQRRVCSSHFDPDVLSKKCPVPHSVPTLDLNTTPGYKIYQNPARLKASKLCLQRVCILESCRKRRADGVHLFRFPHNPTILRKWLHNIKQRPKHAIRIQCRLCSDHFESHSYNDKRLSSGAIPTLNLGHDNDDIYPNESQAFIDEQCVVPGCDSIRDMPDVRLFKFPTDDEDQLWKWCNNLKMNPVDCEEVRICNKHFVPECIGAKHLYKWAIPTLALGHDDIEIELVQNPKPEERNIEPVFKCCVPTCGKTRKYDEVQMNSFPKDPKLFYQWKHNLKLEYLDFNEREKYKICNEHFEDICVGKTRLNVGSIPTLHLGHHDTNLYKVRPEKLQSNLFGKNRPILDDDIGSEDGDSDESEMPVDNDEVIVPEDISFTEMPGYDEKNGSSDEQNELILKQMKMKNSFDIVRCCVPSCHKSRLNQGICLYGLPSSPLLLKKWRYNLQLSKSILKERPRVCNLHFNKRCFNGKQLRKWAVPTLNLGHFQPIYENPKNIPGFFLPTCALSHCRKRRSIDNGLRTYRFPKGYLLKKWCANLGLEPDKCRGRICENHFEPEVRGKLKLRTGAVPTLNLGHYDKLIYDNETIKSHFIQHKHEHPRENQQSNFINDESTVGSYRAYEDEDETNETCDPLEFVQITEANRRKDVDNLTISDISQASDSNSKMMQIKRDKPANNVSPICCLKHCRKEKTAQHHLSTFGFPKNEELLLKWCDNLKLHPKECIGRVCVEHFDPEILGSRKLKQGAVPTINVGHDEPLRWTNNGVLADLAYELAVAKHNNDRLERYKKNKSYNYAHELSHSVFRLRSLKHCRKRKVNEPPDYMKRYRSNNANLGNYKQFTSFICCVQNCGNSRAYNSAILHRFPRNHTLYLKWLYNLQIEPSQSSILSSYKVCNKHFEKYCFKNNKLLKEGAMPTLKLGHSVTNIYRNPKRLRGNNMTTAKCFIQNCICAKFNITRIYSLSRLPQLRKSLLDNFGLNDLLSENNLQVCGLHFLQLYEKKAFLDSIEAKELFELEQLYKSIDYIAFIQALKCSVPGCKTKYKIDNICLLRLPKSDDLCRKWVFNTKIAYKMEQRYIYRVCLLHFEKSCLNALHFPKLGSLPTLNLNHNDIIYRNSIYLPSSTNTNFIKDNDLFKSLVINTDSEANVLHKLESPKRSTKCCCIKSCTTSTSTQVQLFRFPKSDIQLQKWCVNTQKSIKETGNLYICNQHFEPDAICQQKLRPWAVPTLQLSHNDFIIQNLKHIGNFHSEELENDDMKYIRNNYCSLLSCFQKQSTRIKLYQYPSDMSLVRKWAINCKHRAFQARKYGFQVCQDHFEIDCFDTNNKLRTGAVPTLNLGQLDGHSIMQSEWAPQVHLKTPTQYTCKVFDCDAKQDGSTRFFKFPKIERIYKLWCHNLMLETTEINCASYLCEAHFEPQCFNEQQHLHKEALPTINLGHRDLKNIVKNPDHFEQSESLKKCCVTGCGKTKADGVQLSSFPKSRPLFHKWAHNLKLQVSNKLWNSEKVCSSHFETYCYVNMRLLCGSLPTLNLGHTNSDIHYNNVETLGKIKRKHTLAPPYAHTPNLIKSNFKCCFPLCEEPGNPKMRQEFDMPSVEPLRQYWCELTGVDAEENELKLCPLHYIINYEAIYECFEELQGKTDNEEIKEYLAQMEFAYKTAKNNSRILLISCIVPKCTTLLPRDYHKLFPLPDNRELLEKWLHNTTIDGGAIHHKVCSLHFESRCFQKSERNLKTLAIPTLNLPISDTVLYKNLAEELLDQEFKCCISSCKNAKATNTETLYSFPHDRELQIKWLDKIQVKITDITSARVCSRHFETKFIGNVLHNNAIPTLALDQFDMHENFNNMDVECVKEEPLVILDEESNESEEESRYSNIQSDDTATSLAVEPIIDLEDVRVDERTQSSFAEYDNSKKYDRDSKYDNINLSLEVFLEVEHVEPFDSYEEVPTNRGGPNARKCCVMGCKTRNIIEGVKLHKFPQSKLLQIKWMHNVQVKVDPTCSWRYRICSLHFERECFNGNRFRTGTMPTLHLGPRRPAQIYYNEFEISSIHSTDQNYNDDNSEVEDIIDIDDNDEDQNLAQPTSIIKTGKYCQIEGCHNHLQTPGISLHKFPTTPRLWKKWQYNTRIPIDINYPWRFRVCSAHFHPNCLSNSRLLVGSVPTLNLGPKAPSEIYENEFFSDGNSDFTIYAESENKDINTNETDIDEDSFILPIEPEIQLNEEESRDDEVFNYDPGRIPNFTEHEAESTCDSSTPYFGDKLTKSGMGICCIAGCNSSTKTTPNLTLHKYPSPTEHLKKWLHNTQVNVDLTCRWRYRVCSRHFEPGCLRGTRINFGCVPTLHLGPNAPSSIYKNDHVLKRLKMETSMPRSGNTEKTKQQILSFSFVKLHCSIASCGRVSGQDGVSLHHLPLDEKVKERWLKRCNISSNCSDDMNSLRICSRHFESNCYVGPAGKRYLKAGVMPTLNLPNKVDNKHDIDLIKEKNAATKIDNQANGFVYNEIKSGYGKCSLIHCQKQKAQHGVKIYKFPKRLQQQKKWSHNLRIKYDPNRPWKFLICSEHFEAQCTSTRKLHRWAVPTLKLGNNVPKTLYTNEECKKLCTINATSSEDSDYEHSPDNETSAQSTDHDSNFNENLSFSTLSPTGKSNFSYKTKLCCLPHCRRPRGEGIKLFRLPTNIAMIRKWEHNTGISFNESQRNTKLICSRHFPAVLIGIRRLAKRAVPSLNLGPNAPNNLYTNEELDDCEQSVDILDDKDGDDTLLHELDENNFRKECETTPTRHRAVTPKHIQRSTNGPDNELSDSWSSNGELRTPSRNMTYKQHHCCVPHCGLARQANLKLFRVPLEPKIRVQWERNLNMKFDVSDRNINLVCSAHFEPDLIGATRLQRGAVPTLNLTPTSSEGNAGPVHKVDLNSDNDVIVFCNVPGCDNTNGHSNIFMFNTLVQDAELLKMWCENLKINVDNPTIKEGLYKICSAHFESRCYTKTGQLHSWALPTQKLGHTEVPKHTLSSVEPNNRHQCFVSTCKRYESANIKLFRFPRDNQQRIKWCKALSIDDAENYYDRKICSIHFSHNSYRDNVLNTDAIPTLHIPNYQQIHCKATGCKSLETNYSFPEDQDLCAKWCYNLGIEQIPKMHLRRDYQICEKHFDVKSIIKRKLHPQAVPTLFLGHCNDIFLNDYDLHSPSKQIPKNWYLATIPNDYDENGCDDENDKIFG